MPEEGQRMRRQDEPKRTMMTAAVFMGNSFLRMTGCLLVWFISQAREDHSTYISWTGMAINEICLHISIRFLEWGKHLYIFTIYSNDCTSTNVLVIDLAAPTRPLCSLETNSILKWLETTKYKCQKIPIIVFKKVIFWFCTNVRFYSTKFKKKFGRKNSQLIASCLCSRNGENSNDWGGLGHNIIYVDPLHTLDKSGRTAHLRHEHPSSSLCRATVLL